MTKNQGEKGAGVNFDAGKLCAETPCGKWIERMDKSELRPALDAHITKCRECRADLIRFYLDDLTAKGEI